MVTTRSGTRSGASHHQQQPPRPAPYHEYNTRQRSRQISISVAETSADSVLAGDGGAEMLLDRSDDDTILGADLPQAVDGMVADASTGTTVSDAVAVGGADSERPPAAVAKIEDSDEAAVLPLKTSVDSSDERHFGRHSRFRQQLVSFPTSTNLLLHQMPEELGAATTSSSNAHFMNSQILSGLVSAAVSRPATPAEFLLARLSASPYAALTSPNTPASSSLRPLKKRKRMLATSSAAAAASQTDSSQIANSDANETTRSLSASTRPHRVSTRQRWLSRNYPEMSTDVIDADLIHPALLHGRADQHATAAAFAASIAVAMSMSPANPVLQASCSLPAIAGEAEAENNEVATCSTTAADDGPTSGDNAISNDRLPMAVAHPLVATAHLPLHAAASIDVAAQLAASHHHFAAVAAQQQQRQHLCRHPHRPASNASSCSSSRSAQTRARRLQRARRAMREPPVAPLPSIADTGYLQAASAMPLIPFCSAAAVASTAAAVGWPAQNLAFSTAAGLFEPMIMTNPASMFPGLPHFIPTSSSNQSSSQAPPAATNRQQQPSASSSRPPESDSQNERQNLPVPQPSLPSQQNRLPPTNSNSSSAPSTNSRSAQESAGNSHRRNASCANNAQQVNTRHCERPLESASRSSAAAPQPRQEQQQAVPHRSVAPPASLHARAAPSHPQQQPVAEFNAAAAAAHFMYPFNFPVHVCSCGQLNPAGLMYHPTFYPMQQNHQHPPPSANPSSHLNVTNPQQNRGQHPSQQQQSEVQRAARRSDQAHNTDNSSGRQTAAGTGSNVQQPPRPLQQQTERNFMPPPPAPVSNHMPPEMREHSNGAAVRPPPIQQQQIQQPSLCCPMAAINQLQRLNGYPANLPLAGQPSMLFASPYPFYAPPPLPTPATNVVAPGSAGRPHSYQPSAAQSNAAGSAPRQTNTNMSSTSAQDAPACQRPPPPQQRTQPPQSMQAQTANNNGNNRPAAAAPSNLPPSQTSHHMAMPAMLPAHLIPFPFQFFHPSVASTTNQHQPLVQPAAPPIHTPSTPHLQQPAAASTFANHPGLPPQATCTEISCPIHSRPPALDAAQRQGNGHAGPTAAPGYRPNQQRNASVSTNNHRTTTSRTQPASQPAANPGLPQNIRVRPANAALPSARSHPNLAVVPPPPPPQQPHQPNITNNPEFDAYNAALMAAAAANPFYISPDNYHHAMMARLAMPSHASAPTTSGPSSSSHHHHQHPLPAHLLGPAHSAFQVMGQNILNLEQDMAMRAAATAAGNHHHHHHHHHGVMMAGQHHHHHHGGGGDDNQYEAMINLADRLGEAKPKGLSKTEIDMLESFKWGEPRPKSCYRKKRKMADFMMDVDVVGKHAAKRTALCKIEDGKPDNTTGGAQQQQDILKNIDNEDDDGQTKCVVCLYDFELKQVMRVLPCSHMFHSKCVDKWLKANRSCPVCRGDAGKHLRIRGQ